MASNLECVGLGVSDMGELDALVGSILGATKRVGVSQGVEVRRWEDPSGARLVLAVAGGRVERFLPSFAGTPGAELRDVAELNDEVSTADVVTDGETVTRMAIELEERDLVRGRVVAGIATIVALGRRVEVFAGDAEFESSRASLLDPDQDPDAEPPPRMVELGIRWPIRLAAESFISGGMFASAIGATADAHMCGTVLTASRRTVVRTGQSFVVARVRTVGFEADVCMPATSDSPVPAPGNVIAGDVFLVGSLRVMPPGSRLSSLRSRLRLS